MFGLLAVDIGNRRMKFGWFGRCMGHLAGPSGLPAPESVFCLENQQEDWSGLEAWVESVAGGTSHGESETRLAPKEVRTPQHPAHPACQAPPGPPGYVQPGQIHPDQSVCPAPGELPAHAQPRAMQPDRPAYQAPPGEAKWSWWIGSVNRPVATRLVQWINQRWPQTPLKLLQWTDLPIQVRVQHPERVGIDRLLNAVAANRLRTPDRPAVVIDVGTAITVDWLSADGAFCGGAILPGLQMAAKALHQFTDLLPEVSFGPTDEPPPVLGAYTEAAIRSGLFWGAVGAVRELIRQLVRTTGAGPEPPPPSPLLQNGTRRLNLGAVRRPEHPTASSSLQSASEWGHGPGSPQVFLTGGAGQLLAPQLGPDVQYLPQLTLAGIALCALSSPPGSS